MSTMLAHFQAAWNGQLMPTLVTPSNEADHDGCFLSVRYAEGQTSLLCIAAHAVLFGVLVTLWRYLFVWLWTPIAIHLSLKQNGEFHLPDFIVNDADKDKKIGLLDKVLQKFIENEENKKKSKNVKKQRSASAALNDDRPLHSSDDIRNFIESYKNDADVSLEKLIDLLAKETGYSSAEIRTYYRYFRMSDAHNTFVHKYCEEVWKGITVLAMSLYGLYVMVHHPVFKDPIVGFELFPQPTTHLVYIYYCVSIGYHSHRATFQFFDHMRKDFLAMFVHHWVTILLIFFSWYFGLMAYGAVVMFCHDPSDFFLAAAKVSRYHGSDLGAEIFFVGFFLSWIGSRMALFSIKVVWPATWHRFPTHSCHYVQYIICCSLYILLTLHVYWFRLILGVLYKKFTKGSLQDNRSASETEPDTDTEADADNDQQ